MGQSYRWKMKCQEKWIRGRLENGGIAFMIDTVFPVDNTLLNWYNKMEECQ
jgi:hypothetical protein